MGRKHSQKFLILFPNQQGNGIDLGNVEIKESFKYKRFILRPKDEKAEFFLFYSHEFERYWIVDSQDIPPIRKMRSVGINQIKNLALFTTDNDMEMFEKLSELLKEPDYYI